MTEMKINIKNVYELTPLQEGMVFNHFIDAKSKAYMEQVELNLEGHLDISHFESSFQELVNRHDVFRTIFRYSKLKKPLQVVFKERKSSFSFDNLSTLGASEKERIIGEYKHKDLERNFNLEKDSLIRVKVFKQTSKLYTVFVSFHHIILDGWGLGVALKEWLEIYASKINKQPMKVINGFPYSDYIVWLRNQNLEEASRFWEKTLQGYNNKAGIMPALKKKDGKSNYLHLEHFETFDVPLTKALVSLAKLHKVTLNSVLRAIWGMLLQKYNDSNDVVFGSVVSGRPPELSGVEKAVGLFINTIPVRIKGSSGQTFPELLQQVHGDIQAENKYHYYPLYESLAKSELKNELIDHVIAFENYPLDRQSISEGQDIGFSINELKIFEETNFDFNMNIFPGEKITLKITYNGHVYQKQYIEQICHHFKNLVCCILDSPNKLLSEYEILTEDELSEVLQNKVNVKYPDDKTIHELFKMQAEFNPNKKAAVFGDKHLTYKELNSRADALAFLLRKKGVRRQEPVGLISDRSLDTVVGMLAILKSGGCYVPIDPTLPAKRISYILKDCSARFLLTPKVWKLPCKFSGEVIELKDELYKTEFPLLSNENICSPGDLAYIIYTSGTTGKPKGVMVEHRNVVSLILNDKLPFSFNSKDVWTIFHSFSFDFSVWELYGSLLNGGTCVIVPKDTAQDPKAFLKLLQKENVTVLNQTPSAFSHLIEEISTGGADNLSLRYVVFGGEALKPAMLHQLKCSYPHLHLINMYGITETTVHVTYKEITLNEIEANLSSIGRPLPTLTAYVMNKDQNLVPVGSIGELYIGGEGVSKGYINNEALTKERFIVNPYDSSELIYRSGDIVRRMLNGELEYLGRIDHQIKIRGHRIEMGEIENRLLFHPLINEAAVLAYKDQTDANYLCAYVASAEDLSSADLRKYLAEFLPDYMVPAHFIFLSSLPLTSNGKIDRNALPQPEMRSVSPFVEPQSDMERRLAPVWREVLGLERVGIHDDFFEMGGHSLRAAQLVNMIHKNLDMELPLKAVFEYPTIHLMARGIEQENKEDKQGFNEIQPVAEQEHYPASSAQKRMLILNQLEDIGTNYNITGAVQLNGALDPIRLEEAIRQVISRHEALRTSFSRSEDGFIQRVHPQVSFSLESWEKEEPMVPQRVNDFSRPFDLSSAPLLRAGLISMGTEKHVMVLDMHHIISDASSLNTILEEISLFYKGETLPPLRLQYKDVSAWQSERMEADSFRKAEDFWLKELAGDLPVFDLLRKERPRFQSFEGERVDFTVPKSLAAQLQGLAHKTGTTLFMVLLSAYQVLLSRYSGQEDILVGTPAAGRTHADLHRMVGMLGNTLPMRTRVREDLSFRALLENVRDRAIRAFEHQTYPFDQMVEKVSVKRDMSRNPIFDCMFIMHDADAAKLDLENLQVIPYPVEDRSAKVDLALEVTEKDRELETWFQYSTALFSRHEIETMAAHFLRILKEIAEDPDQPLSAVEMISDYERHNLLHRLNPTEIQGEERPIHELFEAQAALTPGRTAIVSKGKEFTYREINEQANRMARALQRKKVKKGDRIGVMVRRSESLMTALLAVLKTGAAYVPIDPEYPEERIAFMAEDSGVKYVIADEAGCFQSFKEKVLPLSELAGTGESPSNPEAGVSADDLAYIIYTSGSTGNPKGVMVEHRSVQNLIEGMSDCVGVSPDDAVLALTTVSFDIFVTETFLPLAKGACVIMASEAEHQDPGLLSRLILDRKVSILQATPSRIKGLVMHPDGEKCLKMVKVLIMGEKLFRHPFCTAFRPTPIWTSTMRTGQRKQQSTLLSKM